MSTLRLFDSTNPLEDRLGKTFFYELPANPGIYRMYGNTGRLLYGGKPRISVKRYSKLLYMICSPVSHFNF